MAKKVQGYIKLQIAAGQANPSPPVGPALGQQGVNIMEFCKQFNAQTAQIEKGLPTPVVITVYSDRSFTFILKTPLARSRAHSSRPLPRPRRPTSRLPTWKLRFGRSRALPAAWALTWWRVDHDRCQA